MEAKVTVLLDEETVPPFASYVIVYVAADQFAVSVALSPCGKATFKKYTFPVAPLTHFVEEEEIAVDGEEVVPHFAYVVLRPDVTVHPVKV